MYGIIREELSPTALLEQSSGGSHERRQRQQDQTPDILNDWLWLKYSTRLCGGVVVSPAIRIPWVNVGSSSTKFHRGVTDVNWKWFNEGFLKIITNPCPQTNHYTCSINNPAVDSNPFKKICSGRYSKYRNAFRTWRPFFNLSWRIGLICPDGMVICLYIHIRFVQKISVEASISTVVYSRHTIFLVLSSGRYLDRPT